MAVITAKVSAMRGEETEVRLAECCVFEIRSSMIQPSLASPIDMSPAVLGFGSTLITGIIGFGDGHGCALIHSFSSVIAFKIVSLGAARVPGPIPTGGREGNILAFSQPSMVVAASCG
ncbi:hypothetical protein Bca52824_074762 [Brassica carinata]|uniref:Uncharacterized protein n=1 Tax=Brassica carinata TaxID=52824 RepID=A0A8X7PRN0_BRACI|nr:hypothetical protein Bca52824_074762 [Brassica carinata]